jgi:hypothetical protein
MMLSKTDIDHLALVLFAKSVVMGAILEFCSVFLDQTYRMCHNFGGGYYILSC